METFLQSNEIKIPKSNKVHPSKIDFKSSFARSLTFSNGGGDNQYEVSKSLDFEINLQPCNENENASCDKSAVKVTSLDDDLVVGSFNESFNKSDEDKERQLWSKKQHQQVKTLTQIVASHFFLSLFLTLIKPIRTPLACPEKVSKTQRLIRMTTKGNVILKTHNKS